MIAVRNEVDFINMVNVVKLTRSAIFIQLVILFVTISFLYEYIPYDYCVFWCGIHILNYIVRWFLNDLLLALPNTQEGYVTARKYFKFYLAGLFISSVLWGMSVLFFKYIPLEYQYYIYYIFIGFTFGSVLSIGPVKEMFFAYILPMNVFALIYLILTYKEGDGIIIIFIFSSVIYAYKVANDYVRFYTSLIEVKRELQEKLHEIEIKEHNKKQYLQMIDAVGIGMVVVNDQYEIIEINNTIKQWFGDFTGKSYIEFLKEIAKFPINDATKEFVTKTNMVCEIVSNEYLGIDNKKYKLYIFKDISKDVYQQDVLNRLALQYKQKAEYDPLTRLLNRNALEGILEKAFYEADRKFVKLAFLFIDIDNFKQINDTYGHHIGDKVLKIIAERLNNTIKGSDIKARYAGDEFVVVLKYIEEREEVKKIAQKLLKNVSEPIFLEDDIEINVSASIGIACYPSDAKTVKGLLQKADKAMYRVKFNTKNDIGFYNQKDEDEESF